MKKIISLIILIVITLIALTGCKMTTKQKENFKIVTSFYPMYTIAKEIANDIDGVEVENMANQNIGCLHDYTLTTSDLKKIETADVFIINGLGIENFTNKILETYSNIKIIDASQNIKNLLQDEHEKNAHIWLSIDNYMEQVENIKQNLMLCDNTHSTEYEKNANDYKTRLENLKQKIAMATSNKKKCISFSESLAYMQECMNLDMLIIETDHEQNGLSAEKLAETIEFAKQNGIKNIIIDKQTAENNARTVAKETGANIYILDSALSGPEDADSYIKIMEENLKIVESME